MECVFRCVNRGTAHWTRVRAGVSRELRPLRCRCRWVGDRDTKKLGPRSLRHCPRFLRREASFFFSPLRFAALPLCVLPPPPPAPNSPSGTPGAAFVMCVCVNIYLCMMELPCFCCNRGGGPEAPTEAPVCGHFLIRERW